VYRSISGVQLSGTRIGERWNQLNLFEKTHIIRNLERKRGEIKGKDVETRLSGVCVPSPRVRSFVHTEYSMYKVVQLFCHLEIYSPLLTGVASQDRVRVYNMCKQVVCPNDQKPTWWGCGELLSMLWMCRKLIIDRSTYRNRMSHFSEYHIFHITC